MSTDSEHKRVLALDVGNKRIGMAISDELRVLARGLETIERKSKRSDLERIGAIVEGYGVGEIVVGHPVRLGGEGSAQTGKAVAFADELKASFAVPVKLWDERLTSVAAEEMLGNASVKKRIEQRKSGAVDRLAAVMILQSYLDARRSG